MPSPRLGFAAVFAAAVTTGLPLLGHAQGFEDAGIATGAEFEHLTDPMVPIGAGAAFVDVDGDGDDDLYAVQGAGCNKLFLNDGVGQFTEVEDTAGAGDCGGAGHGVWPADYDNDGDQDLFLGNLGQNRLYRNLVVESGNLAFEEVTATAGLDNDGETNTGTAAWGDYDQDGHLDLFVGNHMAGFPISCFTDHLWHANGDGTFTDVGAATGIDLSGVMNKAGCALGAAFTDHDRDGDVDLIVVNDFGGTNGVPNRVFRNDGSDGTGAWTFTDVSEATGLDYVQAAMGLAIADINRDGIFDYYSSDAGNNEFGLSNGDGTWSEVAAATGVQAGDIEIWGGLGLVSWGVAFYDLDHDTWEDLVVCSGGAPQDIFPGFFGGGDYIHLNPCYLYHNDWPATQRFNEVHNAWGVTREDYYRGAYASDIDNDGDIDLYFGNQSGNTALYRNSLTSGHWLKVRATGSISNRDALGTIIQASAGGVRQLREIHGGSSFMGRHSLVAHFGLANAPSVDVLATFPSGATQELLFQSPNQTIALNEPRVTATFNQERKL
ncbi:MAG: CRTAC1 family protein, partial [Pseudomonadota bacterium]